MKGDRVHRDIKRNCTFHKDIGHTTNKCVALKDEMEMLIKAGYFKEFIDEPEAVNREEPPRQQSPKKVCEVLTIIGGLHLAKKSHHACDKYAKDAKSPPLVQVHRTEIRPTKQVQRELEDIVLRDADARWVHHPHTNALVITTLVTNSNIHRLMVDYGSAVDVLYLNAYKKMGLIGDDLDPNSSPLYSFTGDHIIPKGVAKLTIIVGEHPRTSTVLANFLVVDTPLAINGMIGRPLVKALKAVTLIYHLPMKFQTAKGIGKVRGNHNDSRECYNKSFQIAEKDN